jgi:hypothetical protein
MSQYRTRVVELVEPGARGLAGNRSTLIASPVERRCDFREIFRRHYDRIRTTCLDFVEPGVAVFAFSIDSSAWRGSMCLAARPGEVRAGVVGRHSACELYLGDDRTLALRHLAVVLEPLPLRAALRGEVRFRIMDLETGSPPVSEEGTSIAALTAEGPVFLVSQSFALMAFVTGDPTDWPESADDAWACLPERVFVEERLADGSLPRQLPIRGEGRISVVRTQVGPSHIAACPDDDAVAGRLAITSSGRAEAIRVGSETVRRGLLVGRYERCLGKAAIVDERVSRVHLLIVELAGRTYAIDLASSNGSILVDERKNGRSRLRIAPISEGAVIGLAGTDTLLVWSQKKL